MHASRDSNLRGNHYSGWSGNRANHRHDRAYFELVKSDVKVGDAKHRTRGGKDSAGGNVQVVFDVKGSGQGAVGVPLDIDDYDKGGVMPVITRDGWFWVSMFGFTIILTATLSMC